MHTGKFTYFLHSQGYSGSSMPTCVNTWIKNIIECLYHVLILPSTSHVLETCPVAPWGQIRTISFILQAWRWKGRYQTSSPRPWKVCLHLAPSSPARTLTITEVIDCSSPLEMDFDKKKITINCEILKENWLWHVWGRWVSVSPQPPEKKGWPNEIIASRKGTANIACELKGCHITTAPLNCCPSCKL